MYVLFSHILKKRLAECGVVVLRYLNLLLFVIYSNISDLQLKMCCYETEEFCQYKIPKCSIIKHFPTRIIC